MSEENTPRLDLPYLIQSQAQKEVTHNTALNILDAFTQTAVETTTLIAPPAGVEGNLYIVGANATGAWAGYSGQLAQFIGGSWNFYSPLPKMRIWDKATSQPLVYQSGVWVNEITAAGMVAFFGATPITRPTVSGAKGGNIALASLIAQLAALGLITDATT